MTPHWHAPIDLYCERLDPGFWAEPVNALSNLAFPLAALWAWRTATAHGAMPPAIAVLIVLAALIGVGSFLFHTFASTWSEYADVVPIWSFVALYVLVSIALVGGASPGRVARIGVIAAACATVVFLATGSGSKAAAPATPGLLNGSGQYAPALTALVLFSAITLWRGHPIRMWAVAATGAFVLSLTFRTLDLHLCPALPLGTHFLWHVLNGLMIGLLLQGLIRCSAPARA